MKFSSTTRQQREYGEFEEKLKHSVYLDNLSPLVRIPILKTTLGKFGVVVCIDRTFSQHSDQRLNVLWTCVSRGSSWQFQTTNQEYWLCIQIHVFARIQIVNHPF